MTKVFAKKCLWFIRIYNLGITSSIWNSCEGWGRGESCSQSNWYWRKSEWQWSYFWASWRNWTRWNCWKYWEISEFPLRFFFSTWAEETDFKTDTNTPMKQYPNLYLRWIWDLTSVEIWRYVCHTTPISKNSTPEAVGRGHQEPMRRAGAWRLRRTERRAAAVEIGDTSEKAVNVNETTQTWVSRVSWTCSFLFLYLGSLFIHILKVGIQDIWLSSKLYTLGQVVLILNLNFSFVKQLNHSLNTKPEHLKVEVGRSHACAFFFENLRIFLKTFKRKTGKKAFFLNDFCTIWHNTSKFYFFLGHFRPISLCKIVSLKICMHKRIHF